MKYRILEKDGSYEVQYKSFVMWYEIGTLGVGYRFPSIEEAKKKIQELEKERKKVPKKWKVVEVCEYE